MLRITDAWLSPDVRMGLAQVWRLMTLRIAITLRSWNCLNLWIFTPNLFFAQWNRRTEYNVHKIYVKTKLRLLLWTAREQYFVRRLSSLNTDMKRNWKVLISLKGGNKSCSKKSSLLMELWQLTPQKSALFLRLFYWSPTKHQWINPGQQLASFRSNRY